MLHINGHTLLESDAYALVDTTVTALISYHAFAKAALRDGRKLWNVTTKFHHWYHLAAGARHGGNPRKGWVFKDEDFVGRVAKIAHSSVFGGGALKLTLPLLLTYTQ